MLIFYAEDMNFEVYKQFYMSWDISLIAVDDSVGSSYMRIYYYSVDNQF